MQACPRNDGNYVRNTCNIRNLELYHVLTTTEINNKLHLMDNTTCIYLSYWVSKYIT